MSANADTSTRAADRANTVPGKTAIDATSVNDDHQTEGFEFPDSRADRRALQSTAQGDVRLCGGSGAVARIPEQAKPDRCLSRRQLLHGDIDEVIQHFEPLP